ncbi:MAG: RadC family protein [Candidatus Acetothermia bacterium]
MSGTASTMRYSITDLPQGDRPREKLKQHGARFLSDSELLALVIRSGTRGKNALDLSREILSELSLGDLSNSTLNQLNRYRGIGEAKASQIMAVFELARRLTSSKLSPGKQIFSLDEAIEHLDPAMRTLEREELRVLHLNNANELINEETIFTGSLDQVQISPREIVKSCLRNNTSAIILAHNHPGGSPEPSEADLRVTKRIEKALSTVEVSLIDHIIVGKYDQVSFNREGYL